MNKKTILVWFRNDLRISDNELLSAAYERADQILPVFIYDSRLYTKTKYNTQKTGAIRARFISESVEDLQKKIRSLGGELIIERGLPEEILPEIAKEYQVDEVYHHREVAYEETYVSSLVEEALWKLKLNLRHFIGHTLYHKEDLPFPIKDIPDGFNVFKNKTARESEIRPSIVTPTDLRFVDSVPESTIPSLNELGFEEAEIAIAHSSKILGGETEGMKQLDVLVNGEREFLGESALSPWLNSGCLSVHTFYHALIERSSFPKNILNKLLDELWWHDYYRFMFKKYGNRFFSIQGFSEKIPELNGGENNFEKWKHSRTDDEQINQIMNVLDQTGYLDQSMRIKAAFYLIDKLQVNWLWGAAYFEEKLIDYSPATNYGSWAHIAGVGSSFKHNLRKIL